MTSVLLPNRVRLMVKYAPFWLVRCPNCGVPLTLWRPSNPEKCPYTLCYNCEHEIVGFIWPLGDKIKKYVLDLTFD